MGTRPAILYFQSILWDWDRTILSPGIENGTGVPQSPVMSQHTGGDSQGVRKELAWWTKLNWFAYELGSIYCLIHLIHVAKPVTLNTINHYLKTKKGGKGSKIFIVISLWVKIFVSNFYGRNCLSLYIHRFSNEKGLSKSFFVISPHLAQHSPTWLWL